MSQQLTRPTHRAHRRLSHLMVALLLLLCSAAYQRAYAVPAKRGLWHTIILENGQQITAQLMGDERCHYYQSPSGQHYLPSAPSGRFRPASEDEISQLIARRAHIMRPQKNVFNLLKAQRQQASTTSGRANIGTSPSGGYYGEKRGLIILVEFQDKSFLAAHDSLLYTRIANEEGFTSDDGHHGSVSDYFRDQSNGLFNLKFDVAGPVMLANDYAYYGADADGEEGMDARPGEMVVEACKAVDPYIDFSNYDWDGDGEAEEVFILYAGLGQAAGGNSNTIWPHMWQISDATNYGSKITLDGTVIDTYACSCELTQASGRTTIDGIGTFCHEFSHCLGLPDIYDTNGSNYGMNAWDLMDYGCYNGSGFTPAAYTSYERIFAGWLTPTTLQQDTIIENMKSLTEGGPAYIIYNDAQPDEYYLLENRQLNSWDAELPGSGLLILHVDYDSLLWENNMVNTTGSFYDPNAIGVLISNNYERLTLFAADNNRRSYPNSNVAADAYPYNGNDSLTNNSRPKASLHNANTDGSKLMSKPITNISIDSLGQASFHFAVLPIATPEEPSDTLFRETFDKCDGKGGNDSAWKGTGTGTSTFQPDNEGWQASKKYGANQCARFNTAKNASSIVSPTFQTNGSATVNIRVAPWTGDNNTVDIYLNDSLIDVFTLTEQQWNTITFDYTHTGDTWITLVADGRIFVDNVETIRTTDTGITSPTSSAALTPQSAPRYNLQGQRVLPTYKGLVIQNGRKRMVK